MSIDFGLSGKRALITGSGQGVGEGIARLLAEAGAEVLVNDLLAERAQAVADSIVSGGGKASGLAFDVTDFDAVHAAIEGAGRVDILVNNAGNAGAEGWAGMAPFIATTPADWAKYLDVNLYGAMNCVHAALPGMIEGQWGRVVTVTSDASRVGEAQMAAYCAAKAGAAGFNRGIAREVARYGITVNNIALGTMRTPLSAALWDDPAQVEQQKSIMSGYLIRRPGDPGDAAWAIAMLVSPRGSWITGQTIPVNGGYSFAL
ncbi:MAG TPA: SDR family NAD(P)-dependent oxidoreductase [Frankiaceae bacterium]|jgi:3-oxoacyl-[acyl-carrier protein] reductase|nr:SDR family NAD(P)-dependent oxidoreductase [Frankiaceae bacterium]